MRYYLGSTPLNQAIVALNEMIPVFKNKNKIEKMSVITLTDGGANWCFGSTMGDDGESNINMATRQLLKLVKNLIQQRLMIDFIEVVNTLVYY